MELPNADAMSKVNKGGVLLGIGNVKNKLNNSKEALKYLEEALELYKKRFKYNEHSMIGKTMSSIGNAHENLGNLTSAFDAYREAVRIFKFTCGGSPLTANSLVNLARCSYSLGSRAQKHHAKVSLLESLKYFVTLDTLSIYMKNII